TRSDDQFPIVGIFLAIEDFHDVRLQESQLEKHLEPLSLIGVLANEGRAPELFFPGAEFLRDGLDLSRARIQLLDILRFHRNKSVGDLDSQGEGSRSLARAGIPIPLD